VWVGAAQQVLSRMSLHSSACFFIDALRVVLTPHSGLRPYPRVLARAAEQMGRDKFSREH